MTSDRAGPPGDIWILKNMRGVGEHPPADSSGKPLGCPCGIESRTGFAGCETPKTRVTATTGRG